MSAQDDPASACPVDHKTREAWLAQARANGAQNPNPHETTAAAPPAATIPQPHSQPQTPSPVQQSCDSSTLDQSPTSPAPTTTSLLSHTRLGTDREISTIPRALPTLPPSASTASRPANSERDTAPDKTTGNWIYPSEQMFFDAMRRKSYDPQTTDMKTIVPIHNAVNERAWHEIKAWEAGRGADACGGPKLASFSGLSTSLTPRARWKTLMGYQAPFDRHDWVVDRCGEKIEYVIDFYAGRDEGKKGKALNFYLDVRPKLNSFEGVKMRVQKFWGFGGS
ncbi:cytochrome c1 heme lyase-like protein [Plenodomus tracheiphilus IPT5]|uniref:Holocytochrome c-type synthase n=1 Tax=Plenodomus tracheiphilus IPT5 TaxID=1408161 RepID=A0A6A7ASQ2_9PLEO|nr:cytochrome c1 heme lyase-like protein [Plenodomus tracheiphilus IPT5]